MAKLNVSTARKWANNIVGIKESLSDDLEKFYKKANSISGSFEGEASDGVLDSLQMFIKMGTTYVDSLLNLKSLLEYIADTMEKQ